VADPETSARSQGEALRDLRTSVGSLQTVDAELRRRVEALDPLTYGLPDLLRPATRGEDEAQFRARQNRELREFAEARFSVLKDGERRPMRLTPKMVEFVADLFYRRVSLAIVWKGRGSGGSVCAALLIWLSVVYHRMSFTNMAGSEEQGRVIYRYTTDFWGCFTDLANGLLNGDPLTAETRLKSGTVIKSISASEKQARGKHNPGFVVDESCQDVEGVDRLIMAAMQNSMSESNHMVVLISTFHHPVGLFQEVWDFAEERGFKRYSWDAIDSMEECQVGMETATPEDPKAQTFCRAECPLTWRRAIVDVNGNPVGETWRGCDGRARTGQGFLSRPSLLTAQRMNRGTNVFEVEYMNERPDWMRPVYAAEWIERALVDDGWPPPGTRVIEKAVGIDWGLEGQTALVLTALLDVPTGAKAPPGGGLPAEPPFRRCVGVLDASFMTGKLTPEALKVLWEWAGQFGQDKYYVHADASHPFNNLEVEQAGFNIAPVPFAKWKDYGIGNTTKFFTTPHRFFIRRGLAGLIGQLKRYRLDRQGRPIKKDDHGPDALLSFLDAKIRIMTPKGWMPVGKLGVGDQVLTHRGRFRKITRYEPTSYQKGEVVLNIKGKGHPMEAFRTTLEHPYLREDGRWIEAENIKSGDQLMFLATRCVRCREKIPFYRKSCDGCAGEVRNARWKDPGSREKSERRKKSAQLFREYAIGQRDAATNASAATAVRAQQIRDDPTERERVRAHLRSLLPLVNTPAKRRRQSELMRRLAPMSDPAIRRVVAQKAREYGRRPEVREARRQRAIRRMVELRKLPFPERMGRKTDIEAAVGRALREIGVRAKHNYHIGRYWVDWAIIKHHIAIECDGSYWHRVYEERNPGRDARRDAYLRDRGWTVVRFSEAEIKGDIGACRDEIVRVLANHVGAYEFTAVEVASVKVKPMPHPRTAYHFEVADDHSYVARGIVSHNCALLRFRFEDLFAADLEVEDAPLPPGVSLLPRRVEPKFDGVSPPTAMPPVGLPPRPLEPPPRKKIVGDGQVVVL